MNEVVPLDEYERQRSKKPRLRSVDTNDLMKMVFEPIRYAVPGYVPEGFSVLAGRQKLGKTWLAIDWAVAVATGGCAIGSIDCEKGDVLYLDLENGDRRIQRRIDAIFRDERTRPDLSRLRWATEPIPLDKGLIDAIEDWRRSVHNPRMVVIDVLQRIKPAGNANRNSYENDYSIWAPLQRWATENGVAAVGLHHTKKGGADDPLEALSGSNGLSACADTTLVLDRDQNGMSLYVRGRDIEERDTALKFAEGIWTILGDAGEVRRSDERGAILSVLESSDEAMSAQDIADATGMSNQNVRRMLSRMIRADEVRKPKRGSYIHPDNDVGSPVTSVTTVTSEVKYSENNGLERDRECDRTGNVTGSEGPGHKSQSEKGNENNGRN